jgi:hypothetical protein
MTPYAHYQYISPLGSSYELSHVVSMIFDKLVLDTPHLGLYATLNYLEVFGS